MLLSIMWKDNIAILLELSHVEWFFFNTDYTWRPSACTLLCCILTTTYVMFIYFVQSSFSKLGLEV